MNAGRMFHHWATGVLLMLVSFSAVAVDPPFRAERHDGLRNLYHLATGELIVDRVEYVGWTGDGWGFGRDDREGIIDRRGRVVASGYHDILRSRDAPFYIVERDGKYGVIDLQGNVRVPLEYDLIDEYPRDGYPWVVRRDGKEGLMDPADQHVRLAVRHENVLLYGGFALATNPEADGGPRYRAFDLRGRPVPGAESDEEMDVWGEDLLIVDDKRVVALDGREVVPAGRFASIRISSETRAIVIDKDQGKAGAINREGRLVVPTQWDYIEPLRAAYKEWMRVVTGGMPGAGGKVGVIDPDGRVILQPRWDGLDLHAADSETPYFRALLDNKTWFIGLDDKPLFAQPFDFVNRLDRDGSYLVERSGKVGLCTNVALADCPIPLEYDSLRDFDRAPSGLWIAQKDGRLGVVQKKDGHVVVPLEYDFLQVSRETPFFPPIGGTIDEVRIVARQNTLNGTLAIRPDEHGSWRMTDEDLDRRPENWQVLEAQAACPAAPVFNPASAASEWRALIGRWQAGMAQGDQDRSDLLLSALDDSVVNRSRAESFVATLLLQPWQLLGQSSDTEMHDLEAVFSDMLGNAAPVRSGGQYPEPDIEFAGVCAEIWYLRIPELEQAVVHRGEASPLAQGYVLPQPGTLKRDVYPFVTLERTSTGLRLAGISRELVEVLKWSYKRAAVHADDTSYEYPSPAATN